MYNTLYAHLSEHNLLFERQLGFRSEYSTKHDMVELIDES